MSNLGKWAPWYDTGEPVDYGQSESYRIAADFLDGMSVEDWGCGCAAFKAYHRGPYLGVDGTASKWADVVDDLATRETSTPGLLLRHVLEHNVGWRDVLVAACFCASERLVIVSFIPDGKGEQVGYTAELDVPDIAVPYDEVEATLARFGWTWERRTIESPRTAFRTETLWLAQQSA